MQSFVVFTLLYIFASMSSKKTALVTGVTEGDYIDIDGSLIPAEREV